MKKLITILVIACCCMMGTHSRAQEMYLPFPQNIQPNALVWVDGSVVAKTQYNYQYFVPYFLDTAKKKLTSFLELDSSKWRWYYEQLNDFATDERANVVAIYGGRHHYFFDAEYNIDSIPMASNINKIALAQDSLIYASIRNDYKNYIVRKRSPQKTWDIVPIVVQQPPQVGYTTLLGWAISLLLIAGAVLFLLFRQTGRRIESIKRHGNKPVDLKLLADKPLSLKAFERYEQRNKAAANTTGGDEDGTAAVEAPTEMNKDTWEAIKAIKDVVASQHTPLPMTIAINGAWGSGKSSIMNCIKELLERDERRFITTWFNAWHQQSEGNLLNAFLLKVINRCEKPGMSMWAFSRFRLRLFNARFMKQSWGENLLTGALLAFMVCFVLEIIKMILCMNHPDYKLWWPIRSSLDWETMFADNKMKIVTTVVVPILSFFFFRSEKQSTLGIFGSLISRKQFLVDTEKNAPDMREKFRTQYWEIMKANKDQTLVVFIDDLDRVDGSKIFDMLEALNFISDVTSRPDDQQEDSLKAVFVLGMYIDQIALNLGKFLQKQGNNETGDSADAKLSDDEKARKLGHQYIEKMVQLNVPVPLLK